MVQYWVRLDSTYTSEHSLEDSMELKMLAAIDCGQLSNMFQPPGGLSVPSFPPQGSLLQAPQQIVAQPTVPEDPKDPEPKDPAADGKTPTKKVDSPLKRAQVFLRNIDKFNAKTRSLVVRLGISNCQKELQSQLDKHSQVCDELFQTVQKLIKKGADSDDEYAEALAMFSKLKHQSKEDLEEAEGVVTGLCRPQKKAKAAPAKPKAKAKGKALAKTE